MGEGSCPPLPGALVRRHVRVGVFGEFSSGKSSLINSLVDLPIQETGVVPVTQEITVIHSPESRDLRPRTSSQVPFDCRLTSLGVSLWDTPGSNSDTTEHTLSAVAAAGWVDLMLVLVGANDGVTRSLRTLCEQLDASKRPGATAWLVLTKFDRVEFEDEEERREALEEWEETIRNELPGIDALFHLDARDLGRFGGPGLRAKLESASVRVQQSQLIREVVRDRHHVLRLRIAMGRDWRQDVPDFLVSPPLTELLDGWVLHCRRMRSLRRRGWWRALLGTPSATVREWSLALKTLAGPKNIRWLGWASTHLLVERMRGRRSRYQHWADAYLKKVWGP